MIKVKKGYTFDDVLLVPKYSEVKSRSLVDTKVDLGKHVVLDIPLISANMKTVTGFEMAATMSNLGGMGILHRFFETDRDAVTEYKKAASLCGNDRRNIGVSVGVNKESYELLDKLMDAGAKIVCVDVAHGNHSLCCKMTEHVAKKFPEALLISGNVATADGAITLYNAGANVVKCGIGNGSLCSTRIETGNGVPQLTALDDVFDASGAGTRFKVLCDGGVRRAGDFVKALCFSHVVMSGNTFAGTNETPVEVEIINGELYKKYAGSSTHKSDHIEGVVGLVPIKGPVKLVIKTVMEGIRSGLSYQGIYNLEDLKKDPEFVSITNSGLIESHPHDIKLL